MTIISQETANKILDNMDQAVDALSHINTSNVKLEFAHNLLAPAGQVLGLVFDIERDIQNGQTVYKAVITDLAANAVKTVTVGTIAGMQSEIWADMSASIAAAPGGLPAAAALFVGGTVTGWQQANTWYDANLKELQRDQIKGLYDNVQDRYFGGLSTVATSVNTSIHDVNTDINLTQSINNLNLTFDNPTANLTNYSQVVQGLSDSALTNASTLFGNTFDVSNVTQNVDFSTNNYSGFNADAIGDIFKNSFGFNSDLFSSSTASWAGDNSFLNANTFKADGSNFTYFGSNDTISLPNLGSSLWDLGAPGTGLFNIGNAFNNDFSLFANAQNFVSPLVFDLNNNGIETTSLYSTNVFFDIDNDGFAEKVGWIKPTEGFLAYDANGNGKIDNITELFGDDLMPAFQKLAGWDSNHDGKIDASDANFSKLVVWQDLNSNGVTDAGELKSLTAAGIKSISLSEVKDDSYQNDNYLSSHATYTKLDNTTSIISDVHFLNDNVNTWFEGAQSQGYSGLRLFQ